MGATMPGAAASVKGRCSRTVGLSGRRGWAGRSPGGRATLRAMRTHRRLARRAAGPLLGVAMLGAVGSCELPRPQIPSIGQMAPAPLRIAPAHLSMARAQDDAPRSGTPAVWRPT